MYTYEWDSATGGYVLTPMPLTFSKEPRPVYYKELDILGFDRHWIYDKNQHITDDMVFGTPMLSVSIWNDYIRCSRPCIIKFICPFARSGIYSIVGLFTDLFYVFSVCAQRWNICLINTDSV